MATLILTTVGTAVAGPFGTAAGALLGQALDARLLAPKARQGPRLGDLSVQTSAYGSDIAKLFGTMRVAGTVIWATDIREQRSTSGQGKGRGKSVSYSYSASFAVALSARRVRAVHRIWADGKLLRGAAGDFKASTKFRLHPGDEEQPPDPLIESALGGPTPAYRGLAYAVFEDLQLADYGNRIPSLTFEVEADAGPVSVGAIAEVLSDSAIGDAGGTPTLGGFAAVGDSVRGAVEGLCEALDLSLLENSGLQLGASGASSAVTLLRGEGSVGGDGAGGKDELRRSGASPVTEVAIAYYEPERDYQAGLQRAVRGQGGRTDRCAVPAALDARAAKALAEQRLEALSASRETLTLHLARSRMALRPGAVLTLPGRGGRWRASRVTVERMVTSIEAVRLPPSVAVPSGAQPGQAVSEPDLLHGPTRLFLFDLPLRGETLPVRPHLAVLAAGESAGWRGAELSASYDGGGAWTPAGYAAPGAVLGTTLTPLAACGSALLDEGNSVEVELAGDGMWLESRSLEALVGGANLAVLGDELLQFASALPIGPRRFRLSRLLRGRRGTEWASAHGAGEAFALLEEGTVATFEPAFGAAGSEVSLMAVGLGDETPPTATRLVTGEALRPPSPVHLVASRTFAGDIAVNWVRRSRNGWLWVSGADTPLAEEREAYRLTLAGAGVSKMVELDRPGWIYTAAAQAADGAAAPLVISVAQVGTVAASRETVVVV